MSQRATVHGFGHWVKRSTERLVRRRAAEGKDDVSDARARLKLFSRLRTFFTFSNYLGILGEIQSHAGIEGI